MNISFLYKFSGMLTCRRMRQTLTFDETLGYRAFDRKLRRLLRDAVECFNGLDEHTLDHWRIIPYDLNKPSCDIERIRVVCARLPIFLFAVEVIGIE